MWLLEIDDLLMRLQVDGATEYEEPGIAHVNGKEIVFGKEAQGQLFQDPVHTHTTYWQRMNEDALDTRVKSSLKNADLVHKQILEMTGKNRQSFNEAGLIVVPSDYDNDQIGLLWGILEFLKISPGSFVDTALVASAQCNFSSNAVYIDLQLERVVIVEVTKEANEIHVGSVKTLTSVGFVQLMKRCIDAIAERSVDETRFDPRVSAETEQQVFEALYGQLYRANDVQVSLQYKDVSHSVSLPRDDLIIRSHDTYDSILAECESSNQVIVNERMSQLPGFKQFLEQAGKTVEVSTDHGREITLSSIATGIQSGDEVGLMKSLDNALRSSTPSALAVNTQTSENYNAASKSAPTHVLYGNIAQPITSNHSIVFSDAIVGSLLNKQGIVLLQPLNGESIYVNDALVQEPLVVFSGDAIKPSPTSDDKEEVVLISVVDHG